MIYLYIDISFSLIISNMEEVLPREIIGEIIKYTPKFTLVDLVCTCKWINELILSSGKGSLFVTQIIMEYGGVGDPSLGLILNQSNGYGHWHPHHKRFAQMVCFCKTGDHLSIINMKIYYAQWQKDRKIQAMYYKQGFHLACMYGHLGIMKNLFHRMRLININPSLSEPKRVTTHYENYISFSTVIDAYKIACCKGYTHIVKVIPIF